jgi:hypothetical protein
MTALVDRRDPGPLAESLAFLGRAVAGAGDACALQIGEIHVICSLPRLVERTLGATVAVAHLQAHLPGAALPVLVFGTRSGGATASLGGVVARDLSPDGLGVAIRDLAFIDALRSEIPGGSETPFGFAAAGRMNADQRIATVWARSPLEAVLKHAASLRPGIHEAPEETLAVNLHAGGRLQMRSLHDWRAHDIDALLEAARRLLDRIAPDPDLEDDVPDGP